MFWSTAFLPYIYELFSREWPCSDVASRQQLLRCPHCDRTVIHGTDDHTFHISCSTCGRYFHIDARSLRDSWKLIWYAVERTVQWPV